MPSLQEALETFLKVDRAPNTVQHYRRTLTRMTAAIGSDTDIRQVTLARLLLYTDDLVGAVQPASFFQYVLVIKAFFSWCHRAEYIDASPARNLVARKPPVDLNLDRAIPTAVVEQMVRVAYANPRDYALILFLADTGARIGGIATLQLKRLNLAEGHAVLLEKGRKFVDVFFWGATIAGMERWLAQRPQVDHDYVFTRNGRHNPLSVDGLSQIVRRVAQRACGTEYGPHSFRHRLAHDWEEAGESPYNIQHKLNHTSLRTTMDNYLRKRNQHVQEASRRLSLASIHPQPKPANLLYLDDVG